MFFSGCRSVCRLHNAVTTINVALFSADANKNSGISKKNRRISCPCPLPKPKRNGCAPVPRVAAACGALLKRGDGTFRHFRLCSAFQASFLTRAGLPHLSAGRPPGAPPRSRGAKSLIPALPKLGARVYVPPRGKSRIRTRRRTHECAFPCRGEKAPRAVFESDCAATIFGFSARRDRM